MKILLVDDSGFMRAFLKTFLGDHEYSEAKSGDEAVLTIQKFPAELVFLDVIMPGMNGVLSVEKIKQYRPEVKIIVQTSAGGADKSVQEALHKGADDFLTKPYEQYEIDKILKKFNVNEESNAKVIKEARLREQQEVSDEHAGTAGS